MIEGEAVSHMAYETKIKEERKEVRKKILVASIRQLVYKLKISTEQVVNLLEIPRTD